jgi:hypothetical protein
VTQLNSESSADEPREEDTLFELGSQARPLDARLAVMHTLYGRREDQRCKTCRHLLRKAGHARTYLKCELTKITAGPGSDWRAGYVACGKWERST